MKLLVTHEAPDFDALASLALARLAHPGAVAVVTGALSPRLRDAIRLYRDELNLLEAADIDLDQVSELIVVDTNEPERIRPFDSLIGKVPITLYDHHPRIDSPIPANQGLQEAVGATATILTRHLSASNTPIPASIATLGLLGITEDTGSFTYGATSAADHDAASLLLRSGANLEFVVEYASDPLDEGQRQLLQNLLEHSEVQGDGQRSIVTATARLPEYVSGTSALVSQLLALHGSDAALVATSAGSGTEIFARVARGYDAAAAFRDAFGGGGHPGAAFAKTDLPLTQALEVALEALRTHRTGMRTAAELMSSPVTTIDQDSSVDEAMQVLRRHGHNGAPVTDRQGRLTGVVSRRDLEHALKFDMHDAKVTGFMNRNVVSAHPAESHVQLEARLIGNGIGRLPVIDEAGRLVGIVTRSDLLTARHDTPRMDVAARVVELLPAGPRRLVDDAARLLPGHARLYLVGGMVRDALLGRSLTDLDLAVEGIPARILAQALQKQYGGNIVSHDAFGTTTLHTAGGMMVDIAATRSESYAHPGALPEVTPGPIGRDLQRRDYTVNAIAVQVAPEPMRLLDPLGGLDDLGRRQLRLLHPLSFVEDPTRVLRGARLAARLGFTFAPDTLRLAQQAMTGQVLEQVSPPRLRAELELALAEPRLQPVMAVLDETGALKEAFGLGNAPELLALLDATSEVGPERSEAALLALLLESGEPAAGSHLARFSWPAAFTQALERLERVRTEPGQLTEEVLARMSRAELTLARCFSERHRELVDAFLALPKRRRLRGSDVLQLGVRAGPEVGRILAQVAQARQAGQVDSFEAELALARSLLAERAQGN